MDPRQRERRRWREHPESLHPIHNLWPHQLGEHGVGENRSQGWGGRQEPAGRTRRNVKNKTGEEWQRPQSNGEVSCRPPPHISWIQGQGKVLLFVSKYDN